VEVDMYSIKSQRFLVDGLAVIVGIAIVTASQYCTLESLTHRHEAAGHHHEGHLPSSGKGQEGRCCFALQAMEATTRVTIQPRVVNTRTLHPFAFEEPRTYTSFEPTLSASGLSHPAREPTLHRPFYYTTFANHAPPLYPS